MKALLLGLAGIWACAGAVAETPPQPVAFRIGPARFERPEGWKFSRPVDGIRAALLEKTVASTPLCITFTRFPPGGGGSLEANLDRWRGQFLSLDSPAEVIRKTDIRLTTVKLAGTMKGGVPGGPSRDTPGTMLLGAILGSPEDGFVVVKLIGPATMVAREEKVFRELVAKAADQTP